MIKKYENNDPDIDIIDLKLDHIDTKFTRTYQKVSGWKLCVVHGPTILTPEFDYQTTRARGRTKPSQFKPDIAIFRKKTGKLLSIARLADPDCGFTSVRMTIRYLSFGVPVFVSDSFGPIEKLCRLTLEHYRPGTTIPPRVLDPVDQWAGYEDATQGPAYPHHAAINTLRQPK